jgi:hypothetical protein
MSKRLIRLNPGVIFTKLGNITGLEVNAVLQNGLTYFGKIESVTIEHIILADARGHLHRIAISELYEIIYDREDVKTIGAAAI